MKLSRAVLAATSLGVASVQGFVVHPSRSLPASAPQRCLVAPRRDPAPPRRSVAAAMGREPRFFGEGGGLNLTPILAVAVLIMFPGFVFNVMNGLFLAVLIVPTVGGFALNWWSKRNLIQAPCPRCEAPIASLKDAPTMCFNCGASLVPTTSNDAWRLRSKFDDDEPVGPGRNRATTPSVIDVEADVE
mmetsp:Transcript_16043/g.50292  ORF Transcript_16043/g.50292 Transcript_16043/m.50292 type:complete len:188 (+) Transcript_16043:2-565(+)